MLRSTAAVLLVLASLAPLSAQAAPPETLAIRDLANRPDRWPATVKLARDFGFSGGMSAKAGQAVKIVEFGGAQVLVDAGNDLIFEIAPADCDLLAGANEAWKALTPAQRALEPAALEKDSSLWPERATCLSGFVLEDGAELAPGLEYEFLGLENGEVKLWSKEHKSTLFATVAQTDLVVRARQRLLLEPDKRTSRIAAALAKGLVDSAGKPVTGEAAAKAKVYVLYFGASWCQPCRKFSPSLVKFANESAAANPFLFTALMSSDEKDPDMLEYMQEEKMPWPALPLASLQATPTLLGHAIGSIPHMVVLDRWGKVLTSSMQGGRYVGPDKALEDLKKLLATGIAR